jgi:aquaporin Z
LKKYIAEIIGTFVMVFMGCGSIAIASIYPDSINHFGISMAFGTSVMVMIYAVGNVSGAHFNPAVTLSFFVAKKLDKKEVMPYIISQIIGALLGIITIRYLFESSVVGVTQTSLSPLRGMIIEVVLTFILMTVILNISSGYKEKGMMAGVAVGFTVFLGALIGGPLTNASMNPARSLAPAIIAGNYTDLWLYIIGPIIGALLAIPVYKMTQHD